MKFNGVLYFWIGGDKTVGRLDGPHSAVPPKTLALAGRVLAPINPK